MSLTAFANAEILKQLIVILFFMGFSKAADASRKNELPSIHVNRNRMSKSKAKTIEILQNTISVLEFRKKSDKRLICGIDPDLTKSGIAIWDSWLEKWVKYLAAPNEEIPKILSEYNPETIAIYLEAGWMNKKSNFRKMVSSRVAQNIAMKVGQNHAVGKMLASELRSKGFEVIDTKPLYKGLLKGKNGWTKAGKDHIIAQTGITSRINDEVRDALYIALNKRK